MSKHNSPLARSTFKKVSLGTVLVSSLCSPVIAQQSNTHTNQDEVERIEVAGKRSNELSVVDTTVTKMDVSIKDTGRSVMQLDADSLRARAIVDIREAFDYVAGFRANGPADRTYTARGVRTSIDNVMVDGLRTMQGGEGGTGSKLPSTFNAQSTTFLRGPESLLNGSGIAGGLVNVTTKQPQAEAKTSIGFNNRSYVSGDTGNFKRNNLSLNLDSTGALDADEDFLYRVLTQYTPSGDHFQKNREIDETLLDLALTAKIGENTTITPRFELADRERTGGSGYADGVFESNFASGKVDTYGEPINRGEYYGSSEDVGENESKSFSVKVKHQFNDNWKATLAARHNKTTSQALDLYISDSGALNNVVGKDEVNRKWVYSAGDDSYNLYDLGVQGKFATGEVDHHILVGYNYRDLDIEFTRAFQDSADAVGKNTISASNPANQIVGAVPASLYEKEAKVSNQRDTNLYFKDRVTLGSTTIIGGLARIKSNDFSDTIWDLGLVQKLTDDINLFTTYSRAFDPISESKILKYGQGKTDYKPVEGNNYEIGVKGNFFDNDLTAAVTLFSLDRTNSTKYEKIDGKWHLLQLSGKSFESKGIEIDSTLQFNQSFSTNMSYAYTKASDTIGDKKGIQANNTPKHSLSLWNTYQVDEQLSFALGLRYESERNDGDYKMESYVEADLGAYYNTDDWDVAVVLNNVFDKNRVEGGANWVTVQPNDPRALNVSFNYHF